MTLRPDDVKPAELHDALVFGLGQLPGLFPGNLPVVDRGQRRVEPLLSQKLLREKIRIAAEQNIGPAPSHIRRNGDGLFSAGLRDDLGLTLVVLGIEHLVRDAPLLQ